jgi:hypothetical protein
MDILSVERAMISGAAPSNALPTVVWPGGQTSYYCRRDYDVRSPLMPGLAFLIYLSAKVATWREAMPIVPNTLPLTLTDSCADKVTGRLQRDTSDL